MYRINFAKDRQKFAAAHFTIFNDGSVERLHGHNYVVAVTLTCEHLCNGLAFPFHQAKQQIQAACDDWDEYVLLPADHPWLDIGVAGDQVDVHLTTPELTKTYSFPFEDVQVLHCDNISCENLAVIFGQRLAERFRAVGLPAQSLELTLSESAGQSVTITVAVQPDQDEDSEDTATDGA